MDGATPSSVGGVLEPEASAVAQQLQQLQRVVHRLDGIRGLLGSGSTAEFCITEFYCGSAGVGHDSGGMNHTPSAAAPERSAPRPQPWRDRARLPVFQTAPPLAVLVCWLLVVFDGYDLIVYGTVQSSLISDTGWGLTKATAGTIGSMAFAGMMIGAIFAGRMADTWGRRRTILGCAVVFSVFTILCAFAPNAAVFGALRLLAGIGLGGLVPSANALVAELVPTKWRSTIATLMMSGVPIGGSIAALAGIPLIPAFGWQVMFLVAVVALLVVIPLGLRYLPETLPPPEAPGSRPEPQPRKTGLPASDPCSGPLTWA